MKTAILFTSILTLLLCSNCRKDKSYTLKGRLLESCENPVPVAEHVLYVSGKGNLNPEFSTDSEGRFKLTYELDYRTEYITIRGNNGFGSLIYMDGIPMRKNLDVGDIYMTDNFFVLARISVQIPTSEQDTIYYDERGTKGFQRFAIGPFEDGEIIDTFIVRNAQVYDLNNIPIHASPSQTSHTYKVGFGGKRMHTGGLFEACKKYNYFDFEVK